MKRPLVYACNILVTMVVLASLVGVAGVAYVWWSGKQAPSPNAFAEPVDTPTRTVAPKPAQPNPDAPVSASIQSLSSPVAPGDNAVITVRSGVGAACKISVEYNKVKSADSGLIEKPTDEYGMVSWSWSVEPNVPLGTWPVDVTCSRDKKSAMVRGDLVVKAKAELSE